MDFELDNMYCGAIHRGDVFLLDNEKEQAVLVLQDSILNERLDTVVVAALEPHEKGERIFKNEVLLKSGETGLGIDAVCKLYKICAIDRRKMIAKKGELAHEHLLKVLEALDMNLGRFRDE